MTNPYNKTTNYVQKQSSPNNKKISTDDPTGHSFVRSISSPGGCSGSADLGVHHVFVHHRHHLHHPRKCI